MRAHARGGGGDQGGDQEGITSLTEVQAACLGPGIDGYDILAKSNTGSGKTLAFLMVGIERILKNGGPDPDASFAIVVLTPVTDLAQQIYSVAQRLCKYHGMRAEVVIGGSSEKRDIARLSKDRIDVLVATIGRLRSILNQSGVIRQRLGECQTFVIDEADKMTEPGFLKDTKHIHSLAMNRYMQTMMFSATVSKDALMSLGLLAKDAVYIDAALDRPQVNTRVTQEVIVTEISNHLDAVVNVVRRAKEKRGQRGGTLDGSLDDYGLSKETVRALREWDTRSFTGFRIMVFLPSNAYLDYFAEAFSKEVRVKTFVLHGGLQQRERTKTSEAFRTTDDCILFTSDASARGVDYPDVSCVIQVGYDSRAEYLQRVGRTGRAGKAGLAVLIVAPEEAPGVDQICDVITRLYIDDSLSSDVCRKLPAYGYNDGTGVRFPDGHKNARAAFRGWLGALASKWKRLKMKRDDVLGMAQDLSYAMGLGYMPADKLREKLNMK